MIVDNLRLASDSKVSDHESLAFKAGSSYPAPKILYRKMKNHSGCDAKPQAIDEMQDQTPANRPPLVKGRRPPSRTANASSESFEGKAAEEIYKPHRRYIMTLLLEDELRPNVGPNANAKSQSDNYKILEHLFVESSM
jgi:hypothetical protein